MYFTLFPLYLYNYSFSFTGIGYRSAGHEKNTLPQMCLAGRGEPNAMLGLL